MKLAFAADCIGEYSEVWMWRQLTGMRRLEPCLLTWKRVNESVFPLGEIPVKEIVPQAGSNAFFARKQRIWRHRYLGWRQFCSGNYYGFRYDYDAIDAFLKTMRPAVILCQYGPVGLRMLPNARKRGIPVCVHFHAHDIDQMPGMIDKYDASLRAGLKRFDAVVCVGGHQVKKLLDYGVPRDKLHCIPCGILADEFCCHREINRTGTVRFATVSRLVRQKGLDCTINAFAKVLERGVRAELAIVGDGEERTALERLIQDLGIGASVKLHGFQTPAAIKAFLEKADIFLQHSMIETEGSPVAIAEAASCSLPVVSTYCGGIPELIVHGENGFLVEQGDVDGMADYMNRLVDNPELRWKMGQVGRVRIVNHFDARKQIDALEKVLCDIANKW